MPEIAEVARIVHFIRKHLVGKTLSSVLVQEDTIVYGKVGTSASEFQRALTGKKVVDVGRQGKYFWLVMDSSPHPLMHFGMSGWMKMKDEHTYYYRDAKHIDEEWPPKYWKFVLQTAEEPKAEAAFVDARRLARIRLLDCAAEDIRKVTPLKENGPDPVIDKDIFTEEWLVKKMRSKKAPVKAVLLDQGNISGIGNWVGDEVMYHSRIHPEQYSNTLSDAQLKQLHKSIVHICTTAVDLLADSERFPEEWLFKHRWGKGKKDASKTLPNGEKILFLTVGGRTSAVVPSVQKKTGPVAADVDEADVQPVKASKKTKGQAIKGESEESEEELPKKKAAPKAGKTADSKPKTNGVSNGEAKSKARKRTSEVDVKEEKSKKVKTEPETTGRRRSTRVSKA